MAGDERKNEKGRTRDMIKLSVIMPLYNQRDMLVIGLDSVPKRADIEIIVIDDCSTDDSFTIVEKYQKDTGKNITLLHNERNRGIGYTVNRGLDVAKGEYIVQLDSDGDYFINLENAMDELDGTDIIYFSQEINDGKFWIQSPNARYPGSAKFVRREFIGDSREPHLENSEDNAFYKILMSKHPTEKFIDVKRMYLHYNYPRKGSLTWNVQNNITPAGMKRE